MDKKIEQFLEMLKLVKWQNRFEGMTAGRDPQKRYVINFLQAEAEKFAPGEQTGEVLTAAVDAHVGYLHKELTCANADWLTAKLKELLGDFDAKDSRAAVVEARKLVLPEAERYSLEWVKKAEDALDNIEILNLRDQLDEALKPFEGCVDDFVGKARALIAPDARITKSWRGKAHESLKILRDKKPRDIAREAELLKSRLVELLCTQGFEKDNRVVFFDARGLVGEFVPTVEWINKAVPTLIAVHVEFATIRGRRTLNKWTDMLPKGMVRKPVDVLEAVLAEEERTMLWVVRVHETLESLKGFKPTCTKPGCTKHVGLRQDGKKYFDKCRDHKTPAKTVEALSQPASPEQIAAFEAQFNVGKKKNKKNGTDTKDVKEEAFV